MKKLLASIAILSLVWTASSQNNLTVAHDTIIHYGPLDGGSDGFYTQLYNNSGSKLNLKWSRTEPQMPTGWSSYVCIGLLCYDTSTWSSNFLQPLDSGDSTLISFYIENDGATDGPGIGEVTVWAPGDSAHTHVKMHFEYHSWPLGLDDPASVSGFEIYPNPASDMVTLCSGRAAGILRVADLAGRTHFTRQLNPGEWLPLDVSGLPAGIYVITLTDTNRSLQKLLTVYH